MGEGRGGPGCGENDRSAQAAATPGHPETNPASSEQTFLGESQHVPEQLEIMM